jgi:hypothetical protein
VLQFVALVLLFRPDTREWFKRRGQVDTNVFD